MPFSHILAQETAVGTLTRALRSGRVHHAYRFEGPDGVGKELAAFALAQALVCEANDPLGCGVCSACKRAVTLSEDDPKVPLHPDVTLIERGLYPPEVIGKKKEANEVSVDQIRTIVLSRASYPPHEGKARVYIFRRAEELSTSAANALLKILEEPRQGTHFILLTSRGDRLLNTIRSRTLPIRFAPLPDEVVRNILVSRGIKGRLDLAIELAAGSASAAIELADEERSASRDDFVSRALAAADARDLGPAVDLAETAERDKSELHRDLRALAAALARSARSSVNDAPEKAALAARRYEAVARAAARLERNAAPMLALVSLITELRDAR
ncbi:MAG: DNA polymerase III subunit [Polyangiaceae bacterium]|nr:DNA polymerase III subunit [Polyangiaceae bacterium]